MWIHWGNVLPKEILTRISALPERAEGGGREGQVLKHADWNFSYCINSRLALRKYDLIRVKRCILPRLILDEVFVISRIIKFEVLVID